MQFDPIMAPAFMTLPCITIDPSLTIELGDMYACGEIMVGTSNKLD
jgi:hypothetical protein